VKCRNSTLKQNIDGGAVVYSGYVETISQEKLH